MDESPKRGKDEKVEHFDEIVDWCRSHGHSDFDFEGLERRILEVAKAMQLSVDEKAPNSAQGTGKGSSGKLLAFKRSTERRDS